MTVNDAIELAALRAEGTISADDDTLLGDWIVNSSGKEYMEFATACAQRLERVEGDAEIFRDSREQARAAAGAVLRQAGRAKVMRMHRKPLMWAAALIILFGVAGLYLWLHHETPKPQTEIAYTDPRTLEHPPTITLEDGTTGNLDITGEAARPVEDFVEIRTYDSTNKLIRLPQLGTGVWERGNARQIVTPPGQRYRIIFPDSSIVMLNALSMLEYDGRKMMVDGEAYFLIAPDAGNPVTVKTRYTDVQVLGTRFNIKSYEEDHADRITLLEGAISITKEDARIEPETGKQLLASPGKDFRYEAADTSDIMAWTKGYFGFKKVPVKQILDELVHWYGITIKGEVPDVRVSVDATRKTDLQVLVILLKSAGVKCELKGRVLKIVK